MRMWLTILWCVAIVSMGIVAGYCDIKRTLGLPTTHCEEKCR
jgi:hypothetical protein